MGCCETLTTKGQREQGEENPPRCHLEWGGNMPLEGIKWLKSNVQVMKEKYPFTIFAFDLIFKVEVQARVKTGNKNISPIVSEQTEIMRYKLSWMLHC